MADARVRFGIDRLLSDHLAELQGLRVGLVTNDTATTAFYPSSVTPSRLALQQAGVNLTKLFAPEHGLNAAAADGTEIKHTVDVLTGLPAYSLYGSGFGPSAEMLADLDLLLFDIPDIGARFYTYIWTLSYVLESCASVGLPLWILDRPNPLGGTLAAAEGPMLDETNISSFIGRWTIPIRHSLTAGELAQFWNDERMLRADLRVITAPNWQRDQHWLATDLPFVPTSPAIPSAETVFLYLITCFIEGTSVSEGRGTATPFRVIGAPWLDGIQLAAQFNGLGLPGVTARPTEFTPSSSKHTDTKHANMRCRGIMLHLLDPVALRPVMAGLHLIHLLKTEYPEGFAWLPYPTVANATGSDHFDRLVGTTAVRTALDSQQGSLLTSTIREWTAVTAWQEITKPFLLYP